MNKLLPVSGPCYCPEVLQYGFCNNWVDFATSVCGIGNRYMAFLKFRLRTSKVSKTGGTFSRRVTFIPCICAFSVFPAISHLRTSQNHCSSNASSIRRSLRITARISSLFIPAASPYLLSSPASIPALYRSSVTAVYTSWVGPENSFSASAKFKSISAKRISGQQRSVPWMQLPAMSGFSILLT